jgi:uncharacterized protein YuzE
MWHKSSNILSIKQTYFTGDNIMNTTNATKAMILSLIKNIDKSIITDSSNSLQNCVAVKLEENGDISDIRIIRAASKRVLKKQISDFIPKGYIQLRNWDLKIA